MEKFFDVCIGDIVEMIRFHMRSIEDRGAKAKVSYSSQSSPLD
jgi:hypothetical protein